MSLESIWRAVRNGFTIAQASELGYTQVKNVIAAIMQKVDAAENLVGVRVVKRLPILTVYVALIFNRLRKDRILGNLAQPQPAFNTLIFGESSAAFA